MSGRSRPPAWVRGTRRLALLFVPAAVRRDRSAEMESTFEEMYATARRRGRWIAARLVARELRDLLAAGVRLRLPPRGPRGREDELGLEWGGGVMGAESWQDLKIAVRTLAKRPGFLALTTVTLALGIGANTAIFGVVHAVVLRPLPYPDPGELVMVWHTIPRLGWERGPFSYPNYEAVRDDSPGLAALAAYTGTRGTLLGQGPATRVGGTAVTGDLFTILGVAPKLGRPILPDDDDPAAEPVAVISHGLWTRVFGADPEVIGRPLRLADGARTIVGVMPTDFPEVRSGDEYWVPLALDEAERARDMNYLLVLGRLGPGVAVAEARADMGRVLERVGQSNPDDRDRGAYVETRHEMLVGDVKGQLWLLAGAVALALLAACANVAGLSLTRGATRRREHALRRALGSGRARLMRHLLAESVVVASIGGLAGIGVAHAVTRAVVRLGPADLPRRAEIAVDPLALLFLLGLTSLCVLAFGLAPALSGSEARPGEVLREGGATAPGGRARTQGALAAFQIAAAVVLVVGGGLLVGSLVRLQGVGLGFDPGGVLTARVPLPDASPDERLAFADEALGLAASLPGVHRAGLSWSVPFNPNWGSTRVLAEGTDVPSDDRPQAQMVPYRGDVYGALGLTLVEGAPLSPAIRPDDPLEVVVNEAFARALWPEGRWVGRRFRRGNDADAPWNTVRGVVADAKARSLSEPAPMIMYQPLAHANWIEEAYLVLRTDGGDPLALVPELRARFAAWNPDLALDRISTLDERVRASTAEPRMRAALVGSFAGLVALLAIIGVYGVMSLAVAGRVRDIGVRMALGAGRETVLVGVLRQGALIGLVGVAGGVAVSLALSRVLEGWLYGVGARDPGTYLAAAGLLLAATVVAALVPARRASSVQPMAVLREE